MADVDPQARVLAFYLPQFHPIPENDLWWGPGFTEWTNVRRARPWFDGHDQPRVPSSLGYYDLRNPEVHFAQAEMARSYGLAGFCYYAYWFAGKRLLEEPLEVVRSNPALGMPYAICWANEPWSRRWDGSEDHVLMPQRHSPEVDRGFIDAIAEHMADARYIRVRDRPLLVVYRPSLFVEPMQTTDALRDRCVRLGLGDPYLAMVQSFGQSDPRPLGFDAAVEFPPHGYERLGWRDGRAAPHADPRFNGPLRDYLAVVQAAASRSVPDYRWFRGVMPDWDNTPRRAENATVYVGARPDVFGDWLKRALQFTYLFNPPRERLVFVNAWNEWGEGAYLEPDVSRGATNLEVVAQALHSTRTLAEETATQATGTAEQRVALEVARAAWRRTNRPQAKESNHLLARARERIRVIARELLPQR